MNNTIYFILQLLPKKRKEIEDIINSNHKEGMKRVSPMFFIAETTPQHYHTANGYFPADRETRLHGCTPLPTDRNTSMGDDWRNDILHNEFSSLIKQGQVTIIPMVKGLQSQYDAHAGDDVDCTHWCYPSGIQKYWHQMYFNAIERRLLNSSVEALTNIVRKDVDKDFKERPHSSGYDESVEDLTWRLHPTLRNGNVICFLKRMTLSKDSKNSKGSSNGNTYECGRIEHGRLRLYADLYALKYYEKVNLMLGTSTQNNNGDTNDIGVIGIEQARRMYHSVKFIEHPLEVGDLVRGDPIVMPKMKIHGHTKAGSASATSVSSANTLHHVNRMSQKYSPHV